MNYHNITHDDMLNGDGLRVVLWVSGCEHKCYGCQNPQTHPITSGISFDEDAEKELFKDLEKEYIAGITFSGGDPLHPRNRQEVLRLIKKVNDKFNDKTIWIYTGYTFEDLLAMNNDVINEILNSIDILVDGKFYLKLKDVNAPWVGSTNQRVIDTKQSLQQNKIILWKEGI